MTCFLYYFTHMLRVHLIKIKKINLLHQENNVQTRNRNLIIYIVRYRRSFADGIIRR